MTTTTRLVIAPKGDKGRAFAAELLAWAEADPLWDFGRANTETKRPIWMVVAGSEQEMRAFSANLLTGKTACRAKSNKPEDRFEIVKSAGFMHHSRKVGDGVATTFYYPELLRIDPGMVDPEAIRFVVIPARAWVWAQSFDLEAARTRLLQLAGVTPDEIRAAARGYRPLGEQLSAILTDEDLHVLLAEGSLMLAYLDRRCRFPIPFDPVFGAWLLLACRLQLIVHRPSTDYRGGHYRMTGADNVNVYPGFTFHASHDSFGAVLANEIQRWWGQGSNASILT